MEQLYSFPTTIKRDGNCKCLNHIPALEVSQSAHTINGEKQGTPDEMKSLFSDDYICLSYIEECT